MYRYLKLVEYIGWYMMGDGCLLYGAGDPCNPRCSQSKAKALHKKSTFPNPSRPFKRLSRGKRSKAEKEAENVEKAGVAAWLNFNFSLLVDLCKQPIGSRHRRHRKLRKQILRGMSLSSRSQSVAGRQDHFNWDVFAHMKLDQFDLKKPLQHHLYHRIIV